MNREEERLLLWLELPLPLLVPHGMFRERRMLQGFRRNGLEGQFHARGKRMKS